MKTDKLDQKFVEIEIDEEKNYEVKTTVTDESSSIIVEKNIKQKLLIEKLYYESFLYKNLIWLFMGEKDSINEEKYQNTVHAFIYKVDIKCIKINSKDFIKVFMTE